MTDTKHTPGPRCDCGPAFPGNEDTHLTGCPMRSKTMRFHLESDAGEPGYLAIADDGGNVVAEMVSGSVETARTLAAAPDLLAVAEMVEVLWRGIPEIYRPGREHGLRAVRAAIKLATEGRPLTDEDRAAIARARR